MHLGLRFFICFDIKTWGTGVTSNWWLLREGGFLGRKVSNQCFFPLCAPQKATLAIEESHGGDTVEKSTVRDDMAFWGVHSGKKHCEGRYGFLGRKQ